MIISLREIPNCFAIWEGGSETLPYGWCAAKLQFIIPNNPLKNNSLGRGEIYNL